MNTPPMNRKIIVNSGPSETRLALIENEELAEIHIERHCDRGIVGNIYLAKVKRVLPGMQAAFVDFGHDKAGFLYAGDVVDPEFTKRLADKTDFVAIDSLQESQAQITRLPIDKALREGQHILIQVTKEALGTKGARVNMFVSIPGRFLVLIPHFHHIGISRRITDEPDRDRLRTAIESFKDPNIGLIVRTAAGGVDFDTLKNEYDFLKSAWERVNATQKTSKAPSLIYGEPELALRLTRDLFAADVSEIVVDDAKLFETMKHFLDHNVPGASQKLQLFQKNKLLFDDYDIEMDIARALGRKVWLPSGGYLVIDQTEALTSFDVNTGKFVGRVSAQETILKTNLEAVKVIVSQLRLRNIGGIIVIDFIDMEKESDREQVSNTLQEALKFDKARTNVLAISELGLVQMTRKRTSASLEHRLMDVCNLCEGRGRIMSLESDSYDLIRDIERHVLRTNQSKVTVKIRPDLRRFLESSEKKLLEYLEMKQSLKVEFEDLPLDLSHIRGTAYEVLETESNF